MHRRTCLALAVASGSQLAGCTFLRNGSSGDGAKGNGAGDLGSGQTGFGPGSPSDEDLVRGLSGAAQAHLQAAVDELVSQGKASDSLDGTGKGPPVTAKLDSLSADPVRDELARVEDDTRRVRALELERDRKVTLVLIGIVTAIEGVANWLYAVLDAYPPLHELYLETHSLVQEFATEDVEADVQPVVAVADEASPLVDDVVEAFERIDHRSSSSIASVDAVTRDGIRFQTDRIAHELAAGRSVADAVEAMQAGDDIFWPARATYPGAAGEPPEFGVFEAAAAAYSEAIAPTALPASMQAATEFCDCYARELAYVARTYSTANEYYKFGAPTDESPSEYVERAESAIEKARRCSVDWSE